jgi:DNA-binding NarL/FixJ family response regulator
MAQIMERLHLRNRAQILAHAGRMGWMSAPADS